MNQGITIRVRDGASISRWVRGAMWVLGVCLGSVALQAEEPVILATEHVDLRIRYRPEATPMLDIVATNDDARPAVDHPATNTVLQAAEFARLELPGDLPPLGSAGDPIWVLPASQKEGLLYLGMSAEGNPFGVFDGPLEMRLMAVDGPGHFFLWQAELGGLTFWMNSRDGLGSEDVFHQSVGGHSHFDWGFTTSGVYRLTFQAEGRRLGEASNVVSDPTTFTFHVLPLPEATRSPFQQWQAVQWPDTSDPSIVGPESDPDGDGLVNLWEYASGRSPISRDSPPWPGPLISMEGVGAEARVVLRVARVVEASDVDFGVHGAGSPEGPWHAAPLLPESGPAQGGMVIVTFRDPGLVSSKAVSFYRVDVKLKDQR